MQRSNPWTALAALAALAAPLSAQVDYRNLDDDRPTRVEDATSIERHAFELLFSYALEREKGGGTVHAVVPELAHGLLPNFHVGLKAPLAVLSEGGTSTTGLSGLRAFALYSFNTEGTILPAMALRVDGVFPVGELAGSETWAAVKGILSRSFGRTRAHLNAAWRLGPEGTPGLVESPPRWWAGLAVDRTFVRQSLLLIGEAVVEQEAKGAPVGVAGTLGLRWQWSPTTVLDVGVARGFRRGLGPDVAIAVGVSHVFAIRALMPGAR